MSESIFRKNVANFYLLLLLVTLSTISISLDIKHSNSTLIRSVINDFVINPVRVLAKSPASFFENFTKEKLTIEQLQTEIEVLKKENISLKINIQRIDALENEVTRLRSIRKNVDDNLKNIKIAKVSARNVIPNKESIQINAGSAENTKIGQTVITTRGLIGQVVEVNQFTSKVLLISDINSNVPAILARTGKPVIVKGGSDNNELEISFLPNDSDIQLGDLIITSGEAGRFLPAIKVGRVIDIVKNENDRFATVIVEPSEKLSEITEIILTSNN